MKNYRIICLLAFICFSYNLFSQIKIGNNPTTIGTGSLLELESTNKGFVLPRMTGAQMNAIASPVAGMFIYNTDSSCIVQYMGTAWRSICGGNTGSPYMDWHISGNAGTVAATNFIGTTDAIDFVTRTNNTEKMRVMSGGNVGIGTATPSQRLEVSGGSVLTNRAFAASTVSVAANTVAFTTGANAATQVRITDNASATANGNLTYGATAIEGQYLWITNADAQSVPFTSTSPATTILPGKTLGFVYVNSAWKAVNGDTNDWSLTGNSGTSAATNFIGTTDAIDFVTRTNNAEKMRVTSAGNVGIGTSTPATKLHVVGNIRMVDGSEGAGKVLTSDASGTGTWANPSYKTLVTKTADQGCNSTAWTSITELSFPVTAGNTYRFEATVMFTSTALTEGLSFALNGPAYSFLAYSYSTPNGLNTNFSYNLVSYDQNHSHTASQLNNIAVMRGAITASASGTITLRYAEENANFHTIKSGSILEYW